VNSSPHQASITNASVFSPSLVNEFRFGYTGFNNEIVAYLAGVRDVVSEIGGFAGVPPSAPSAWGVPNIAINGFSGFGDDANGPWPTPGFGPLRRPTTSTTPGNCGRI